ncbi:3-hexulose-6-phosphate synthase [Arthrobacter echini]|uniref:3-hexulose-6-phosphate synthase n=1 Tax=Arthrobacter echini TaxID=1529066 RepID=A0A4S5E5T8_9MICC|nr:3-hexulose-6-phosphate synthase [Arthrobacter echini]THJ66812.1 3-hexulose-6-phosphate synthase [Arthrobacter echini]
MKLQLAMDVLTLEDALELSGKVAEYVDIIELGTPLVKNAGLAAVTAIKAAHPDKIVFADLKTMDTGELEAGAAFEAGADLMTVLGVADDSTIAGAIKAGKDYGRGVVVDLIGVGDKAARAKEVTELGAEFVEFHAGLDEQAQDGYDLNTLLTAGKESGVPFSVAGGVELDTIKDVQSAGATVAVVGSGIYSHDDPAKAARELREAIS